MPRLPTSRVDARDPEIAPDQIHDLAVQRCHALAEALQAPAQLWRRSIAYDWANTNGHGRGIIANNVLYFVIPTSERPPADARLILEVQP